MNVVVCSCGQSYPRRVFVCPNCGFSRLEGTTSRQRKAWDLHQTGMSYAAIAREMGISTSAARDHVLDYDKAKQHLTSEP